VLPHAEHTELWVHEGRVTYEPVRGATTVAEGWVVPGLVDAHCHIGLDAHGPVPDDVSEQQALADRNAGTLLVRDAGSAADTRWIDEREDLPRVIRAGRHIARTKRYLPNFGVEIEPVDLVAEVERQAARGDGWVKLVGDWIDRSAGDLLPCWPADAVAAAIARAHELGVRVTAHVFAEQALRDVLEAGIDCVEHGSGLTDDLVALMAAQGTALVPTRLQLDNFPRYADQGEARFPAYAATMRGLHARLPETLRAAFDAGIPVYAGTDAGGVMDHGLIAREVQALHASGLSATDALAGASWGARAWLGATALEEGASADLVVYPADPCEDLAVLADPARIILRGAVVA
jgi:imidazolonepropionase-like amidohydrolase